MSEEIKMSDVFNLNESIGFPAYWSDDKVRAANAAILSHDRLVEENRRLTELAAQKASRADELFEMLSALSDDYSELLDKSINYIGSHGTSTHAQAKILLSKIKQESNDE